MSEAAMDRTSGMRGEGAPAWMYAYRDVGGRPRREQAVEEAAAAQTWSYRLRPCSRGFRLSPE